MIFVALTLSAALVAPSDDVLARVDGVAITRGAVDRRMEALESGGRGIPAPEVLDGLVDEALLAADARRLGLSESTPEVAARIQTEIRTAAERAYVDKEVAPKAAPDERALLAAFHETADFVSFESLTYEKREAAQAALDRLRKGATFATEARTAVVSQTYPKPESAPPVMRGELPPALAEALFGAAPGTLVGPVQLPVGFSIARPIRKELGQDADFAARRAALTASLKRSMMVQLRKHLVDQLVQRHKPVLDEAFVRGLPKSGLTAAQLDHVVATVGGHPIRFAEVQSALAQSGLSSGHLAGPSVRLRFLWEIVERRLVQEQAIAEGFDKAPAVAARTPEFVRFALGYTAAERIQGAAPAPGEDDIEAFYRKNAARYGRPLAEVLPDVAARAALEKKVSVLHERLKALRKKASITVDKEALARVTAAGAPTR